MKYSSSERIRILIKIFDEEGKWLTDKEAFSLFNVKNFCTNLKRSRIIVSKEDLLELKNRGFFDNKLHEKAIILLEFLNSHNRYPKKNEIVKGFNIYSFAEGVKNKTLKKLSHEDYNLLTKSPYLIKKRRSFTNVKKK